MANNSLNKELDLKVNEYNSALVNLGNALTQAETSGDSASVSQITADILAIEQGLNQIQEQRGQLTSQESQQQVDSKQAAKESLATGEYKEYFPTSGYTMPGGIPIMPVERKEKTNRNLATQVSQALDISPEAVDVEEGLPLSNRIALSYFRDPELKAQYIKQNYPNNSEPLVIDGEPAFAIKTNDGKVTLSTGTGNAIENALAIGGGLTSYIFPTLGGIGGASLASPSVVGTPVAFGAGYFAAGSAQDVVIQQLLGVEQPLVKTFTNRGIETAISVPIDIMTAGTGKFLSRRIGANSLQEAENATLQAMKRLSSDGMDFDVPAGVRFGPMGIETQKILASQKSGKLRKRIEATQEQLLKYSRALKEGLPDEAGTYQATINRLKADHDQLVSQIAGDDDKIRQVIQSNLDKRLGALQIERPSKEPVGNLFKTYIDDAEVAANEIKRQSFNEFYNLANSNKLKVDPDQMANVLLGVRQEMKGKRNPATDLIEQELRQRKFKLKEYNKFLKAVRNGDVKGDPAVIKRQLDDLKMDAGPLDYQTMNAFIERVEKEVPDGGSTGQAIPKQVADVASARLQAFRDQIYQRDNMQSAWGKARLDMQNRMAFEGQTPASMVKSIFGEDVKTPSQVADVLISDPTKTRKILDLLLSSSDQNVVSQVPQLRGQLQEIYLDSIGLSRVPGVTSQQVKFNPEIVKVLWGVDRRGNINEGYGQKMVQKMDYLNKAFADAKVPIKDVTPDDINMYFQSLDENSSNSLAKAMVSKAKAQDDLDKFTNNKVVDLALKGKWEFLDGDSLPKALISNTTSYREVGRVLSKMPESEKSVLKNDFMRELLNNYSGGQPMRRAPFATFWDTKRFLNDIDVAKGKSDIVKKMEAILGPEETQKFIDISRVMDATTINNAPPKDQVRSTIGMGGASFYLAEGVSSYFRNAFYAAMLGSKAADKSGLLRFIAKDAGPEATEKAFQRAIKLTIGTRVGIQALTEQARHDPRVAAELQKFAATMNQSEREAKETIDKK